MVCLWDAFDIAAKIKHIRLQWRLIFVLYSKSQHICVWKNFEKCRIINFHTWDVITVSLTCSTVHIRSQPLAIAAFYFPSDIAGIWTTNGRVIPISMYMSMIWYFGVRAPKCWWKHSEYTIIETFVVCVCPCVCVLCEHHYHSNDGVTDITKDIINSRCVLFQWKYLHIPRWNMKHPIRFCFQSVHQNGFLRNWL